MTIIGYVISAVSSLKPNEVKYYNTDRDGFSSWTTHISCASTFSSPDDAEKLLTSSEFVGKTKQGNKVFPPTMIHSGSGVEYSNPVADLTIRVVPMCLNDAISSRTIRAEIVTEDIRARAMEKLKEVLSVEELAAVGL